ncbi:hypothetical protein GEMRC1_010743 [Eukaryota sp. GEM-RC1]
MEQLLAMEKSKKEMIEGSKKELSEAVLLSQIGRNQIDYSKLLTNTLSVLEEETTDLNSEVISIKGRFSSIPPASSYSKEKVNEYFKEYYRSTMAATDDSGTPGNLYLPAMGRISKYSVVEYISNFEVNIKEHWVKYVIKFTNCYFHRHSVTEKMKMKIKKNMEKLRNTKKIEIFHYLLREVNNAMCHSKYPKYDLFNVFNLLFEKCKEHSVLIRELQFEVFPKLLILENMHLFIPATH